MYDLLFILMIVAIISSLLCTILFLFEMEFDYSWAPLGSIAIALICYILITNNDMPENFTIHKTEISIDSLKFNDKHINVIFPENLKCDVIEYDLNLSAFGDYTIYRIYIDSSRYIEIIPEKHNPANNIKEKNGSENKKGNKK